MKFNLCLDDATALRLDRLAKQTGTPRNALVRKAVEAWIDQQSLRWPKQVLDFPGDPSLVPFEAHRNELRAADDDPLLLLNDSSTGRASKRRAKEK